MKKNLLLLMALVLSAIAYAQPTLTQANSAFAVGNSYNLKATTFPGTITTGSMHTWNFGTASPAAGNVQNWVVPSTLSKGSSFPAANVASFYPVNQAEQYYVSSSSSLENIGIYVNSTLFEYYNTEVWMQYPFTFGNTFTDPWACTYTNGIGQIVRGGSSTTTADGYGTITLPNGTFSNVLRIKQVQDYGDSTNGTLFISYLAENIQWYLPGVHYPIAASTTLTTGGQQPFKSDFYLDPIWPTAVNDIKSLESFISFYPNPVSDKLTIKAVENLKNAEVILCTMNGAQVLSQKITSGSTTAIDISALSNGSYLMHLSNNGQKVAGEIITVKH